MNDHPRNKTEIEQELKKPERSPKFAAWMESLNTPKVRRASGESFSIQKFEKNWSTSRR
jgi:hypothetical protein